MDRPDISIYRTFDSHVDLLLFFLPMKWIGNFFYTHFKNQVHREVEKNLHRYISDLTGTIIKTIDGLHKQAIQFIGNEFKIVENILDNDDSHYEKLAESMKRLKEIKSQLYA